MNRRVRKTLIVGYTTTRSEKQDKRIASGKIRVISHLRLARNGTPVDYREAGDGSRNFSKDENIMRTSFSTGKNNKNIRIAIQKAFEPHATSFAEKNPD